MATYQIILPLPPRACSGNKRGHYSRHSGPVRSYRDLCAWEYRRAVQEKRLPSHLTFPLTIHLDYYLAPKGANTLSKYRNLGSYYPRDEDNARTAFKAGQDALQDAGIIPCDTPASIRCGRTALHTTRAAHQGRIERVVTIETPG